MANGLLGRMPLVSAREQIENITKFVKPQLPAGWFGILNHLGASRTIHRHDDVAFSFGMFKLLIVGALSSQAPRRRQQFH